MLLLMVLLTVLSFAACHRKRRVDPVLDIPDLPADTVYITRVIDRCNYQYLSPDPAKARKQLQAAERSLDELIAEYDGRLKSKSAQAGKLIKQINEYEKD